MINRQEVLDNLGSYNGADFTVRRAPLVSLKQPVDGVYTDFTNVDSHVALIRNDTNQVLSVVGSKYKPVHHVDAFKTAEKVITLSDLNIDGINRKIECSHNGARAYSIYTLPNHKVNLGRHGDDVALTISARNSFDGSWSFVVEVGGYRFICLNMQVFANNFAVHKSKHTRGLNLQRVADRLSEAVIFYDQETELWKEMVDTKIREVDAFEILASLAKSKPALSHLNSRQYDNVLEDILWESDVVRNATLRELYTTYWQRNRRQLGSTAWALYNTMTEWATHETPKKQASIKNVASIRVDRLDKVRKVLNDTMLPNLRLAA